MTESADVPVEVRVRERGHMLAIAYADGQASSLRAEYLRVSSPSAEVQGHSPAEKRTVGGKKAVRIVDAVPVGHYALRLVFDDGHDSGLYTWPYLRALSRDEARNWQAYLDDLARLKLSRGG